MYIRTWLTHLSKMIQSKIVLPLNRKYEMKKNLRITNNQETKIYDVYLLRPDPRVSIFFIWERRNLG